MNAAQEEEWEAHQAELARTAGERRKARKQREREKAQKQEKVCGVVCRTKGMCVFTVVAHDAQKKTKKTKAAAKGGIKKPLTAYMFFSLENREDIKAENPDADFGTIAAIVGNECVTFGFCCCWGRACMCPSLFCCCLFVV